MQADPEHLIDDPRVLVDQPSEEAEAGEQSSDEREDVASCGTVGGASSAATIGTMESSTARHEVAHTTLPGVGNPCMCFWGPVR